jgi:dolichol-phosphate mannosyltransferase
VKDETESIPILLHSINYELSYVKNLRVVLVDDGSSTPVINDELSQLCKELNLKVTVIELSRNFGKEAAIRAGLQHIKGNVEFVAIMDGDGQHPVSSVRQMFEHMIKNENLESSVAVPKSKSDRYMYRLSRSIFQNILGREFSHFESDLLVIRSRIIKKLDQFPEKAIRIRDIVRMICTNVAKFEYLPEKSFRNSLRAKSRWSFGSLIDQAFIAIIGHDQRLFSLITRATALTLISSVAVFFYTMLATLFEGTRSGTTTILFVLTLMFIVQILALFVTIFYLRITLLEVKNRPRFLVANTWSN